MAKMTSIVTTTDTMISEAAKRGLVLQYAEDQVLSGRRIRLEGRDVINFGSCSYLALEMDPRLKLGVIEAVTRYGTQFSSSRTYVSAPPYQEVEALLRELFGGYPLLAASTTLGHLSALPVLVSEDDAIVLDQQVHHSLQMAANQARMQGSHVEIVRHNDMSQLEERIVALGRKHRHVWYLADGVYSMFAEFAPLERLSALLAKHPQLHLYLDDSHGMSWAGTHGRGYVLSRLALHPRMVVAASLNKGFAAAGGVLVFPNEEMRRTVRTCGGPMIFSGPIQPPMLGAAIASAKIHLSDEIYERQTALRERMQLCNQLLIAHGLPLVSHSEAPIRFIGMGLPRVAYHTAARLLGEGYYTNVSTFPAVPMKQAGIRLTLTLHQTLDDIRGLVETLARVLPEVLEAEGSSLGRIFRAFKLEAPAEAGEQQPAALRVSFLPESASESELRLQHETTIRAFEPAEWDALLGDRGPFTWEALRLLEDTFTAGGPEDLWDFHYYVVRNALGRPVLATFFSTALWKDDMLARPEVSERVEADRLQDPYHMTSRMLGMGSLFTVGDHLYLDRSADWQAAMRLLLRAVEAQQERSGASGIALRDLPCGEAEFEAFLLDEGFVPAAQTANMVLEADWKTDEERLRSMSQKTRRHQLRDVLPWEAAYDVEVWRQGDTAATDAELAHLYGLYENVKARNFEVNTFALPRTLFRHMLTSPAWEFLVLRLKPEYGGQPGGLPVGFSANFVGPGHYAPMVVGMDYTYVRTHGLYRQLLHQSIRRARQLGLTRVLMGVGATLEKTRFGARPVSGCVYFQARDHYHLEVLSQLRADAAMGR